MEPKLATSCDICKQKRIKCDKQKPCAYCINHKIDCTYSYLKKPGLKAGYGKNVLEKLQTLNNNNSSILERLQKLESNSSIQQLTYLESRIEILEQKLKDINSEPKENNKLPDENTLKSLLQVYFKYIHSLFPILNPMNSFPLINSRTSSPLPTIYGIVICSLRYSDLPTEQKTNLAKYCKQHILTHYIGMQNLESIKALSLLTFYLFYQNNNQESWNLISLLVNGCKKFVDNSNWQKDEHERNITWNVYILDVFNAILNQHQMFSPNSDMLLPMSSEVALSTVPDDTLLSRQQRTLNFTQYEILYDSRCFIIEILTFIYKFQSLKENLKFNDLQNEVTLWKQSIPSNYIEFIDNMDFQFKDYLTIDDFIFHNLYQLLMIFLSLSSFAFKIVDEKAFEEIMEFRIGNILKTCKEIPKFFNDQVFESFGPIFAWTLFITAKLMNNISELDDIIEILFKIGQMWDISSVLGNCIFNLEQSHLEAFDDESLYNHKFKSNLYEVFEIFNIH